MRYFSPLLFASLAFFLPAAAKANFFDDISDQVARALDYLIPESWEAEKLKMSVGGGALVVPDYEGSDNYKLQPLPVIDFRLGPLLFETNQIRYVLVDQPVRAGPIMRLDLGRNEKTNPALAGMGNIGTALEVGGYAETLVDGWGLQLDLRQDVLSGHEGLIGTLGVGRQFDIGDRLTLIGGIRLAWTNGRYMNSLFGVNAQQAAASGYPLYDAGAGFKNVDLRVVGSYRTTETTVIQGGMSYQRLLGDAAQSPLVKGPGSPNQLVFGLTFRYTLWRNGSTN